MPKEKYFQFGDVVRVEGMEEECTIIGCRNQVVTVVYMTELEGYGDGCFGYAIRDVEKYKVELA